MKRVWRLWAKALGTKATSENKDADIVALFRTFLVLIALAGDIGLIINIIHHW